MTSKEEEDFNKLLDEYKQKITITANKYYRISKSMRTLDFMTERKDLCQEGEIILYDCWKLYKDKSKSEFRIVFQKALETGLYKKAKQRKNNDIYIDMTTDYYNDNDDNHNSQYRPHDDQVENRLSVSPFKQYQEELEVQGLINKISEKIKSKIALAIFYEFAYPSPKTIFNAVMDEKRKRMMKLQNKGNYVPKYIGFQYQYIYHSLNITKQQFDYALREIKRVIKDTFINEGLGELVNDYE